MTTTAPEQNIGQSGWHHAVKTVGDMGQQTAGANGAIAVRMTGGKRHSQRHRQSRKGGKRQSRRHRHSQRQRGGRR